MYIDGHERLSAPSGDECGGVFFADANLTSEAVSAEVACFNPASDCLSANAHTDSEHCDGEKGGKLGGGCFHLAGSGCPAGLARSMDHRAVTTSVAGESFVAWWHRRALAASLSRRVHHGRLSE